MGQLLPFLVRCLSEIYPLEEARAMSRRLLLEPPLELSQSFAFTGREEELPEDRRLLLLSMLERLKQGVPLQYVLGHEYFCGLCLKVGPGVLIPRPETQDLVAWIVADSVSNGSRTVLDACTGSGCIAAALATQLPQAQILAVDVSLQALEYAQQNTAAYADRVQVLKADLLHPEVEFPSLDVLVSNPPYIAQEERAEMAENVKNHEPGLALFVPDEDPLLFYRELGALGQKYLKTNGALYVEINRRFSRETCALFQSQGYVDVVCRNDRFGEPRMIKAVKKQENK